MVDQHNLILSWYAGFILDLMDWR